MRTPELSDDELDALFRHGADEFPKEINLGAWSRMEQQLDKAAVQRQVNHKVAQLFVAEMAVVVAVLLLWFGYKQVVAPKQRTAAEASAPAAQPVGGQTVIGGAKWHAQAATVASAAENNPVTSAPTEAAQSSRPVRAASPSKAHVLNRFKALTAARSASIALLPAPTRKQKERVTADALPSAWQATKPTARGLSSDGRQVKSTRSWPQSKQQATTVTRSPLTAVSLADATRRQKAIAASEAVLEPAGAVVTGAKSADVQSFTGGRQAVNASTPGETEAKPARQHEPTLTGSSFSQESAAAALAEKLAAGLPDSLASPSLNASEAAAPATDSAATRPPQRLTRHLMVGLLVSPEVSTVGSAGYTRPGSNLGVMLEYRFWPRWRVSVGALRSVKIYEAHGRDYTFPQAPPYQFDRIDATCRIIDIPLNLRFDAISQERQQVFVSAGLTSLLMRSERYAYDYTYYGQAYSYEWSVQKGSRHMLSVLNLSAGYERRVGARWSVQAEPFAKVPLGGVGAGKVRLRSAGVFFGLKYGLR